MFNPLSLAILAENPRLVDLVLLHLPRGMDPARHHYIAVGRCANKDSWPWFRWNGAGIPGGKSGIQTGDDWCHSCSALLLLSFLLRHICDFHQSYQFPEKINETVLWPLQLSSQLHYSGANIVVLLHSVATNTMRWMKHPCADCRTSLYKGLAMIVNNRHLKLYYLVYQLSIKARYLQWGCLNVQGIVLSLATSQVCIHSSRMPFIS